MTEKEKMIAGKIYDPSDKELVALRTKAHRLSKEYNELLETDERRSEIIKELGIAGDSFYLQGPVQFDYGCFTSIGANSYANFNFTCLDCCPVVIGENAFFGPNVSLLTPLHPLRWQDRNQYLKQDGTPTDKEYAKPITIGNNCWIAGNVTICGGVTIGDGCVIGAGSVVTRDIPANSLAVGVPCRVVREITEADAILLKENSIAEKKYYIAPGAIVLGDVKLDKDVNIWYHATVRGDRAPIVIGKGSNIQDNSVVHVDAGFPVTIGENVTVGHGAIIHGCSIGDNSLVGMGAIIMNGAEIGRNCIVGAGALVTQGTKVPDNSLILGNPAKIKRQVTEEEVTGSLRNAAFYVQEAKDNL